MAYPEPVPVLKAAEARDFERRLSRFRLNSSQKRFYSEARKRFKKED